MRPAVGLDALAYRCRGIRPARNALRPARTPSRIASAMSTGSFACAMAVFIEHAVAAELHGHGGVARGAHARRRR